MQTRGFTFGDNVAHLCDSIQCSHMLRTVEHLFLLVSSIFCAWLREGILTLSFVHMEFCVKRHHLCTVFVLHGRCLCRDIVVVLIASIAIWIPDILLEIFVKLETGNLEDLKYGVHRIIGSGATVPRCLLVVKTAIPLFHDGMKKLQRWKHLISE